MNVLLFQINITKDQLVDLSVMLVSVPDVEYWSIDWTLGKVLLRIACPSFNHSFLIQSMLKKAGFVSEGSLALTF